MAHIAKCGMAQQLDDQPVLSCIWACRLHTALGAFVHNFQQKTRRPPAEMASFIWLSQIQVLKQFAGNLNLRCVPLQVLHRLIVIRMNRTPKNGD